MTEIWLISFVWFIWFDERNRQNSPPHQINYSGVAIPYFVIPPPPFLGQFESYEETTQSH